MILKWTLEKQGEQTYTSFYWLGTNFNTGASKFHKIRECIELLHNCNFHKNHSIPT